MGNKLPPLPFYDHEAPLAIVHRGGDGAGVEKENSIAAFDSAYRLGIKYAETDTVATSDGVLLAIHGSRDWLQQQSFNLPIRSKLEKMTLREVKRGVRVGGEKVPTLEEVLTTFKSMRFFIDPKIKSSVGPLAELINRLNVYERVSVGAFNWGRTRSVINRLLVEGRVCSTIGVTGSILLLGSRFNLSLARRYVKSSGASQFALPFNLVNREMVKKAHQLDMRMIVWTPNTEADIARMFTMGVDGVMSDRTEIVKKLAMSRKDSQARIEAV